MMRRVPSSMPALELVNRNPRNLERLRIARKPDGFHLDEKGRCHWHRLELETTLRHLTARVIHYRNGPAIEASTSEWAVKKHLYSLKDASAHANLGRILARRCLQFGIDEMHCAVAAKPGSKVEDFLRNLELGGISLEESPRYVHPYPWSRDEPEKPWEVV